MKRLADCAWPVNIQDKFWHGAASPKIAVAVSQVLGDHSEGDPPVPIPNTEVKPLSPDGTACASVWESRKLPGFKQEARERSRAFCFTPIDVRALTIWKTVAMDKANFLEELVALLARHNIR